MSEKKWIPTDGGLDAWTSPFSGLKDVAPPPAEDEKRLAGQANAISSSPPKNRGRVDVIRQTAHRGGKTVIVVTGFVGISRDEKEQLASRMQKVCGCGGTVKEGRIEIQGEQREAVGRILTEAGFRPVFAGG